MRHRPLGHKVGALLVALTLPLVIFLTWQWRQHQQLIDFTAQELLGVNLVEQVVATTVQLEDLRTAVVWGRLVPSAAAVQAPASKQALHLQDLGQQLINSIEGGKFADLQDTAGLHMEAVLGLAKDNRAPAPGVTKTTNMAFDLAESSLRDFNLRLAERSGLLFDPDQSSYFLMDLAVERLSLLTASVGRTRAAAVAVLARGDASTSDRERLRNLIAQTRLQQVHVSGRIEALRRSGAALPKVWPEALRQVDEATQRWGAIFEAEAIDADPQEAMALGSQALSALRLLHQEIIQTLKLELDQRIAKEQQGQKASLLIATAALLLATALSWLLYRSFVGSVNALVRDLELATSGNLSFPIAIRGSDEVASLGQYVDRMCKGMSLLVADIRSSATRLAEAGQVVASEGVALAYRTDVQAGSLRQSVEVMEALVGQVALSSEHLSQMSGLTEELHQQSQQGNVAMMNAVQSMDCLQASAKRVAEINDVIDDIAFQTNLVALNASVEAAKAGESGRGFSVVATEIRQLAQRCVSASAEVRDLIDTTNSQVESTSLLFQSVGSALISLQTGVEEVLGRLKAVANSSAEQTAGLEEVAAEIISLQGLTQEGAAAVDRYAAASTALITQSQRLSHSVKSIKLRQGTSDEAKAMVQQAQSLVSEIGWENAAAEFNQAQGAWCDRDMFVFAWDGEGVCLAHGLRPQWVGRVIYELPVGTVDMIDDFLQKGHQVLQSGTREGWIDYSETDANTQEVVGKAAYVIELGGGGFMGCAVNRSLSELPEQAEAPTPPTVTAPSAPEASRSPSKDSQAVDAGVEFY